MEQAIWITILIIIALIVFTIILIILEAIKGPGLEAIREIFNISKFLEYIGIRR
jgi:hypothetical protein